MFNYITSPDQVAKVLNDNVLVKVLKTTNEYMTASGIYLAGVEHDFLSVEVVKVNEYFYDEESKKVYTDIVPGDQVLIERNFSHRYGMDYRNKDGSLKRDRIDHLVLIGEDKKYRYYIIDYNDIYLKEVPNGTPGAVDQKLSDIKGTLYSIMPAQSVQRSTTVSI